MADNPSPYGRVVKDGQETATLVGAVVDLVGRPLSSVWRRRSAVQALRERLGEWAPEAVDKNGRWLQPVLRSRAFEDHLVRENGHFKPSGSCESAFAWAHLLYALDIRPGRGVLAWKLPTDGIDLGESGQMSLHMDGEVLCHIINLYRIYRDAAPKEFLVESTKSACQFPFGSLSIQNGGGARTMVLFESGTLEELCAPRLPFRFESWTQPREQLQFDEEVVVTRYYNALHHGASHDKALLPQRSRPLAERAPALAKTLEFLRGLEWDKPFLLTPSWLDQASHIKRRVTTDGGEDSALVDDVITALSNMPNVCQNLQHMGNWQPTAKRLMKEKCMFQKDSFNLIWDPPRLSYSYSKETVTRTI